MSNLKEWILGAANGEPIEAVVIGDMCGWGDYGSEDVPTWNSQKRDVLLSWDEASPMLDYSFDAGFGAPGCNDVVAWSKSRVIYIHEYDGSTSPQWLPRNPEARSTYRP